MMARRVHCPRCRAVFRRRVACCPLDGTATRPLPPDPMIDCVIAGRYRVVALAGERRDARVYCAVDGDSEVEVHVLWGERAAVASGRDRFERGARIAAGLSHPHLQEVSEAGRTEAGLPYFIAEPCPGPTLEEVIERDAPVGRRRLAALTRGLCAALAYLHDAGIVHGALAPTRITVAEVGDRELALVGGFDLARVPGDSPPRRMTRKLRGAPGYMAPEVVQGRPPDRRSDLYALGVILYELLAGTHPFAGTPLERALRQSAEPVPTIAARSGNRAVDPALERIALGLLSVDPEARYGSARLVARALARALNTQSGAHDSRVE